MSSSKKYPLLCLAHLCLGLSVLLILSCMSCLCVSEMCSLWISSSANISSHSGLRLSFILGFLCCTNVLWLIRSHFLIFGLFFIHLRGESRKPSLWFMSVCPASVFLELSQYPSSHLDLYILWSLCMVLGSILTSFSLPQEPSHHPSQRLLPVYTPSTRGGYSLFSTPSPAVIVCRVSENGHSDWCDMIAGCGFYLHF